MNRMIVTAAAVLLIGCNGSPTAPGPGPTPTPQPEVTLSVRGWVRDTIDRSLPGARVDVISGRLAGAFVITSDTGEFAFAEPVPVNSQLKVSKSGYVDVNTAIDASTRMPLIFRLNSPALPVNLSGVFDISFEADQACTTISDTARRRTYQASLRSMTELSGASFLGGDPPFNVIQLSLFGNDIKFSLNDPPVWELVPDQSHIMITGEAIGVVDENFSELQLILNGSFRYCPKFSATGASLCAVETVTCASSHHVVTVRRR